MDLLPPPILPNWRPRKELSRPSAEQINRLDNRKQTLTYAGAGEVIPIVYGEQLVSGPIIAGPAIDPQGNLMLAVALCYAGEAGVERVEDFRLGSTVVPLGSISSINSGATANIEGISVRVLDGRQTIVPTGQLSMPYAIPGFDDAFQGIAYAIIRVSTTASVSAAMSLAFRIKGRRVFDPRPTAPWLAPVSYGASGPVVAVGVADLENNDRFDTVSVTALGELVSRRYSGAVATYSALSGSWARSVYGVRTGNSASWFLVGGEQGKLVRVASGSFLEIESGFGASTINAVMIGTTTDISYAVGEGGTISRGTDSGGPLTLLASPVTTDLNAIARSQNNMVIVGDDGVILSAVGTAVTAYGTSFEEDFNAVALAWFSGTERIDTSSNRANRMIAVGNNGQAAFARGGVAVANLEWHELDVGFGDEDLIGVAYHRGIVAVLGASGRIRVSVGSLDAWQDALTPQKVVSISAGTDGFILITESGETLGAGSILAYTENPALHMRDFVTDTEFGMGLQLIGGETAADVCDSLYAGSPRARTGLCIQDQMTAEDALALFSMYAEVMYSFDGRDVSVVPDIKAVAHDIDASTIREGSVNLSTASLEEIPTLVRVNFRDVEDPQWSSRPAVARVFGSGSTHGAAEAPSTVELPGVYRRIEADRRASQRLARLQASGRISWQMFAPGLPYQAGDVVRMPDVRGMRSIQVRLMSQPEMIAPLLYQMGGEIYEDSHYPESLAGVAVPTGAIVPYSGTLPDGYQQWRPITGLVMGHAVGGQNLSASGGSFSIGMEPAGAHRSSSEFNYESAFLTYQTGSGIWAARSYSGELRGEHAHSASISTAQMVGTLGVSEFKWAKRVGEPDEAVAGIGFLSDQSLASTKFSAALLAVGRYLGVSNNETSRNAKSSTSVTSGIGGRHHHGIYYDEVMPGTYRSIATMGEGGEHSHRVTAVVDVRLKSRRMALYRMNDAGLIPSGGVVGWEGGAIPEGWLLCDGNNGTVDLRDYFVFLSTPEDAGGIEHEASSATVTGISVSTEGHHEHLVYLRDVEYNQNDAAGAHRAQNHPHTHAATNTLPQTVAPVLPARRTLRFIQYIGE